MVNSYRPNALPKNFTSIPAAYPLPLLRPQLEAARRYLFDGELQELMEASALPLEALNLNPPGAEIKITVTHVSAFMQGLKNITGDQRAVQYGHEAFAHIAKLLPHLGGNALNPALRAASDKNKLFLKIREAMSILNKHSGANILVKWHGEEEAEMFEDTAQHCYGYQANSVCCQTMSGFLQEAVHQLSGVKVELIERECMATGALACRWHCKLL